MRKFHSILFIIIGLIIVVFMFALTANAQEPVRSLEEKIQSGNYLFAAQGCSSCHSVQGKGGKSGPDLTRATVWASPILGAAVMWNHVPIMAKARRKKGLDWPDFKVGEIGDIFTYLGSLNQRGGREYSFKGDVFQGESRFVGTCQKCHGVPFKGGSIGPDLGPKAAEMKSEVEFATRMLRHAPKMAPIARRMKIPWPQLNGSEMAGVFQYLKSFKPATK